MIVERRRLLRRERPEGTTDARHGKGSVGNLLYLEFARPPDGLRHLRRRELSRRGV
jgi:hypothetical protein